jgi:heptosyltransferase-2
LTAVAGVAPATETAPRVARAADDDRTPALVVQTSFLGDMVLTTPLIASLAERGPVDVVATPATAPLVAGNPAVRRVFTYDKAGADRGIGGLWRLSRSFRLAAPAASPARGSSAGPTPVAYLAQGSIRSAIVALLSGARERIGFSTSPGRALYTRTVLYRTDHHHAERLWSLGAAEGERPTPAQLRPRLFPSPADVAAVDELLAGRGWRGEPIVALAPGSIWGTKRWPHYEEVARRLADHVRVAIVGGPADSELARRVAEAAGPSAIDASGRLGLVASAELIRRAAVIVTNDSAPLHLASAMATPTVAIFGPTVPDFGFGPLAPSRAIAGHESLDCRPCHRHGPQRCPLGHWRCMREIDPTRVLDLTLGFLHPTRS